jgi:UDP-3-O-[3-hydroxymyristoyl] glucosamine N-acyltransferase
METTVEQLAKRIGGRIEGDPSTVITGAAKIEDAEPGDVTFLANPKYARYLDSTRASAVIIAEDQPTAHPCVIRVEDPRRSFARLIELFYPPENPPAEGIHPTASIGKKVTIGEGVRIGAQVTIGDGCTLEKNVIVFPGATIGENVVIGEGTVIHAGVSIRFGVRIGRRVCIQDNAVIGSEGFGFAPTEEGVYEKVPQMGAVVIEDDVEIGAGCTIDRATLGATRICKGAKLDNLIQVAHNVVIGENTVIAAQTGISGSTRIGKGCMIGGQVGFVGHITLGDGSLVGAQSGISKSYPPGSKLFGYPAKPHGEELRLQAYIKKLPELSKQVRRLEEAIEELRSKLDGK